jgi:glycerophosphoryl diester phosphodiesterase
MTRNWPYPRIFAHRGGGSLAPENTLAAIRLGQSLGYRAHEFDVKLSRDDVALLMHDESLERTTNGKGRAADFEFDELRGLDAGQWHSELFKGEPVPTFEDAAKLLRSKNTMANVEIKPTPGFDWRTGTHVALHSQQLWQGADAMPLLSSFSFEALMAAKEAAPGLANQAVHRRRLGAAGGAGSGVAAHRPPAPGARRHCAPPRARLPGVRLHRERRGRGAHVPRRGGGRVIYRQPAGIRPALSHAALSGPPAG